MKKIIIKDFITIRKVRYLPLPEPPPPPPPPPVRRVLVVGLYALHMITSCDEHPKPGILKISDDGLLRLGGQAPYICTVLKRLGSEPEFLGVLSDDPTFEYLTSKFHSKGIDISSCPYSTIKPSHQCITLVSGEETRTTVEYYTRKHELTYQQFIGAVDYQKYSWIHFEPRNYRETVRMMQAVRDYNARSPGPDITLSVDMLNLKPSSLYLGLLADYVYVSKKVQQTYGYMNGREVVWAVREGIQAIHKLWESKQPIKTPNTNEIEPDEEVLAELNKDNCEKKREREPIILFAQYEEGASCLMPDGKYFKVGGHKPKKMVDTIGEHETFVGAIIYAIQDVKLSLRDSMEYATRTQVHKIAGLGFDCLRCMPKDLRACYYA